MDNNEPKTELIIKVIKESEQKNYPKEGDRVTLHFTTLFENGEKIDSSRDRNYPFSFNIGKGAVIKGWEEGLMKVSVG